MSVRNTIWLSLFLVPALIMSCGRKDEPPIVARVDQQEISVAELKTRFALTPYFSRFPEDNADTKKLVMASLIGEKLLAGEARASGIDRAPRFVALAHEFQKEALLEVLMQELFSPIELRRKEVQAAMQSATRKLEVNEWVFQRKTAADSARRRMSTPAQFDEAKRASASYSLTWGQAEPVVEDVLWALRPGETSEPVEFNGYYYVFHLAAEQRQPVPPGAATAALQERVEGQLMERKKRRVYNRFFKSLMAGKRTQVPAEKLRFLAEELEAAFAISPTSGTEAPELRPRQMADGEYEQARLGLADHLADTLVSFDDGSTWTVGDFLFNLRFGPYPLNYSTKGLFRASLRNQAVVMMEQEYLAQEARRRGLQETDYVRDETQMWLDSFLADQERLRIVQSGQKSGAPDGGPSSESAFGVLDRHLAERAAKARIEIRRAVLDTLTLRHTNMAVFKRHFPGRAAAPAILPFDRLLRFLGAVLERMR